MDPLKLIIQKYINVKLLNLLKKDG